MTAPACPPLPATVYLAGRDRRLRPMARVAYIYLTMHLTHHDCRPVKAGAVAHYCGTGKSNVFPILRRLVELGYLECGPDSDGPANRRTHTYRLTLPDSIPTRPQTPPQDY